MRAQVFLLVATGLVCGFALSGIAPRAHAQSKTLAGRWNASPMQVQWIVGQWGSACGPRPAGGGDPGGPVIIKEQGRELQISGAGRTYSTASCWERLPGLRRQNHSAGKRGWTSVCKTPATDSRQATVRTTITATDQNIHFDETGQYQFLLQGQNCTASTRRTRRYTLLQRAGETPLDQERESPPSPASATGRPNRGKCAVPGAPFRIQLKAPRKLMRAGSSQQFEARVIDNNGCPLRASAVRWKLSRGAQYAEFVAPGELKLAEGAPEGTLEIEAQAGEQIARWTIRITSKQRYEALLNADPTTGTGQPDDNSVALANSNVGSDAASAEDFGPMRKGLFATLIVLTALVVGGLGLVMIRQNQRAAKTTRQDPLRLGAKKPRLQDRPPQSSPPVTGASPTLAEAGQPQNAKICPQCGTMYSRPAQFCGKDGASLVANYSAS